MFDPRFQAYIIYRNNLKNSSVMFRNSSSRTPKHPIINPNQHDHSIYACECGKSYNNFPALYLHFQRKHSIKISTKEELSNRKVKFENSKRTVTYFYTSE